MDYWAGNLFVANGAAIYEINISTGAVKTFSSATAIASGDVYYHLAVDQSTSELFVTAGTTQSIYAYSLTASSPAATILSGTAGTSGNLSAMGGYLYAQAPSTMPANLVQVSELTGDEIPIAGGGAGAVGSIDGTGTDAWFKGITSFANDGTNLYAIDGGSLREISSGTALLSAEPVTPTVAIDPGTVTTQALGSFLGNPMIVGGTAYVVASNSDEIYQVNLATNQETVLAGTPAYGCAGSPTVGQPAFSALTGALASDGHYLYALESGCFGTVIVRTALSGTNAGATSVVWKASVSDQYSSLAFGSDGNLYVMAGGTLYEVNPLTGAAATLVTGVSGLRGMQVSGDQLYIMTSVGTGTTIFTDTMGGTSLTTAAVLPAIEDGSSFVVAGRYVYVTNYGAQIFQLDMQNGWAAVPIAGNGTGGTGYADGTGIDAFFNSVRGIASDGTNLWVNDYQVGLREITQGTTLPVVEPATLPTVTIDPGAVTTMLAGSFAGTPLIVGNTAYVVPASGTEILSVNLSTLQESVVAGSSSTSCTGSSTATGAAFDGLTGTLATDGHYLYALEDSGCPDDAWPLHQIMRIALGGADPGSSSVVVSGTSYTYYVGLAVGSDGNIYTTYSGNLLSIDPATGATTTVAPVTNVVSLESVGPELYILTSGPSGTTTYPTTIETLAFGTSSVVALASVPSVASPGSFVVTGRYIYVMGIGKVYQLDSQNSFSATPVAGTGISGSVDGTGTDAWFYNVLGITSDGTNLWVNDRLTGLREISAGSPLPAVPVTPAQANIAPGAVTTLAGGGTDASTPGTGLAASFATPGTPLVVGGNSYVTSGNEILTTNLTTGVVSVFAGAPGAACDGSSVPGQPAFSGLTGAMTTDGHYLYVSEVATTACVQPESGEPSSIVLRVALTGNDPGASSEIMDVAVYSSGFITSLAFGADGVLYGAASGSALTTTDLVYAINPVTGAWTSFMPTFATGTLSGDNTFPIYSIAISGSTIYYSVYTQWWSGASGDVTNKWFTHSVYEGQVGSPAVSIVSNYATGPQLTNLVADGVYLYGTSGGVVYQETIATGALVAIAGNAEVVNSGLTSDGIGSLAYFTTTSNGITGLAIASDGSALWATAGNQLMKITPAMSTVQSGGPSAAESLGCNPTEPETQVCHGDPVNTESGNYHQDYTDFDVPGPGLNLDLTRSYNSLEATVNSPFGYGWTDSYDMHLEASGSSVEDVVEPSGSVTPFNEVGTLWVAPSRVQATLTHNANGTWTFVSRRTTTYVFNSGGQLISETNLDGYTTTLSYTGGLLSSVTDPEGRALTFTYNASGEITSVTGPTGLSYTYTYLSGNLASSTDPAGDTTSYTYSTTHELLTVTDPRGNVTLTNTYNSSGEVTSQEDALSHITTFSYAPGTNGAMVTTITDPTGEVTVDTYADGDLSSETVGYGTALAAITRYTYDPVTNAVATETDPTGGVTSYTYDANGDLLTETDPMGNVTTNTYDQYGDVTSVTDPDGHVTTYTYATNGNVLTKSTTVGTQDAVTTYAYGDSALPGAVTSVTDPDGNVTTFTYDNDGNLASTTDGNGNTTTYDYNALGELLSSVEPNGNVTGASPTAFTTSYTYDGDGRVLTTTDPLGNVTTHTYDADGDMTSTTDAANNVTSRAYNAMDELTSITQPDNTTLSYTYDADGRRLSYTNAAGDTTTYAYNIVGEETSTTDALARTTSYGYDLDGNQTTLTNPAAETTTTSYNADNEPTSITYSDGTTPDVTNITYNGDGERTSMTDGTGTSTWTWDALGDMTSSTNGAGEAVSYAYDLDGDETQIAYPDSTGTVTRTFDANGNLTSVSDWFGQTSTFTYDADGNLVSETVGSSPSETDTFTYDADNSMTGQSGSATGTISYTRNANEQLTGTDASSATTSFGYNSLGELTGSSTGSAGTYAYDAAGDVVAQPNGTTLAYDTADELCWSSSTGGTGSCASAPSGATTYTYSSSGDRTSTNSTAGTTTYTYNEANELTGYTSPGGVSTAYAYDGDGMLATETTGTAATTFAYDESSGAPAIIGDSTNWYIDGPGGLALEQIPVAGDASSTLWLHHDQLGSTVAVTSDSGTVVDVVTYDPYGNVLTESSPGTTPVGYAGAYTDAESGLVYLVHRWYDPVTGQFLTVDPDVAETNTPYVYVGDDPLDGTDPLGMICISFHCASSDVATLAGGVSAVTGVVGMVIPAFAVVSEGAAGVAVLADVAACATGSCNYAAVALDVLALVPGGAAVHFVNAAAQDREELDLLEEAAEAFPALENSAGFNELVSRLSAMYGAGLSTTSVTIDTLDQGTSGSC
jgi:RHS repeat-associated protein